MQGMGGFHEAADGLSKEGQGATAVATKAVPHGGNHRLQGARRWLPHKDAFGTVMVRSMH
jgi:hypothetical protein